MTAKEAAEAKAREARQVLNARQLPAAVQARVADRAPGGFEVWQAANANPVSLPLDAPGEWYLGLVWQYATIPAGREQEPVLEYSSISLNVRDLGLTDQINTDCFIRYDIERRSVVGVGRHSSAHINVLQPATLDDHVHFPVVGFDREEWPLDAVLDFFLSEELRDDLAGHI